VKRPAEMETKSLLTVRDVAALLKLDCGTVYHMVSTVNPRLPCLRLSQRCLGFRAEDIEKFIADLVRPADKDLADENVRLPKKTVQIRAGRHK